MTFLCALGQNAPPPAPAAPPPPSRPPPPAVVLPLLQHQDILLIPQWGPAPWSMAPGQWQ